MSVSLPAPTTPHTGLLRRTASRVRRLFTTGPRALTQNWLRRNDDRVMHFAVRSPRRATLYYLLNPSFGREAQAVLHGRLAHLTTGSLDASRFTLRRNTHRLEKGLLMRPRRPVFAEAYIQEAVRVFDHVVGDGRVSESDAALLVWSVDVLEAYFEAVTPTDLISRARADYESARSRLSGPDSDGAAQVPYARDLSASPVSFDAMWALARQRRSVRWYEQRAVPREMIDRALDVAFQAPSACNRQPFEFRVFDDPALVRQVCSIPMGTAGYAENIPAIVVIVGHQRAYFSERDRHLIYIDGSLAAMSFMFGLEAQGLSSCPINWPDIEKKEREMATLLGLAPDERPIMLVSVGFPDPEGLVAFSQKKTLDEARSYNRTAHA